MNPNIHCVVIAQPGHFRTSLTALLASIPNIDSTTMVDEISLISSFPQNIRPDFVFIETNSLNSTFKERMQFLSEIWPGVRTVIFSDHTNLRIRDETYGADCILPKEISAGDFLQLVQRLSYSAAMLMTH